MSQTKAKMLTIPSLVAAFAFGAGLFAQGPRPPDLPAIALATAKDPAVDESNIRSRRGIYLEGEFHGILPGESAAGLFLVEPVTNTWTMILGAHDESLQQSFYRVSPDGTKLAFSKYEIVKNEVDGRPAPSQYARCVSVWIRDLHGGKELRKISDVGGFPIWSSGGKRLLLRKGDRPNDSWQYETWRMNADGSNPERLPIPENEEVQDWSPDGSWLVSVFGGEPGKGYQLDIMHPDGSGRRRLTETGSNIFPRFSPDGRHIAYACVEGQKTNLEVVDLEGKERHRVYEENDDTFAEHVTWSPDGRQLATVLNTWARDDQGQKFLGGRHDSRPRLCIIDVKGKGSRIVPLPSSKALGLIDWR